ncbi:MAG: hypothetical protein JWO72_174 [Caulobacteraceae bacterium]|nr:hypothetical protein [Caulobacteraceae bacterium]
MKRAWPAIVVLWTFALASASQAAAPELVIPAPVSMPALPSGAAPRPVAFARLANRIPAGQPWATFRFSLTCQVPTTGIRQLTWESSNQFDTKIYGPLFADQLKVAGFNAADDPDALFKRRGEEADLQVAGSVKNLDARLCVAGFIIHAQEPIPFNLDAATGSVLIDIDWQLYSTSQDKVLVHKEISTGITLDKHQAGNLVRLIQGGVRENVRTLLASEEFRAAVLTPQSAAAIRASGQPAILLTGSASAKPGRISDAVGGVVLVLSNGGHGSGFLLSSDGYLMTAEHVVGADKYVKVRWSDGLEGVGEVIRTDKRRDVALIKTDPRGRQPLALRREAPQPGDTVFAIGAPIDPKLQNTVTRGVASANRIMDGFSFIQSDVTVDPGNSGGPLLNDKGEVLGFTDIGIRTAEAPTGLKFFEPIGDALLFHSAEPH